jgi:hypothetical protein
MPITLYVNLGICPLFIQLGTGKETNLVLWEEILIMNVSIYRRTIKKNASIYRRTIKKNASIYRRIIKKLHLFIDVLEYSLRVCFSFRN